jgi:hypothetical protein
MKNKYNSIFSTYTTEEIYYNDSSLDGYKSGINITDYIKEYSGEWTTYDPETEEERLARIKAEKRNDKIDQILG